MVLRGLGPALGLAAWVGFFWAAWRFFKHGEAQHFTLLVWVAILFLYMSTQWVKFIRYLLPIYPILCLLAGWALIEGIKRGEGLWANCRRGLGFVCLLVVILGSSFWALAFTSIYDRDHSRVTASRWIFENIPQGSYISSEVWDDSLPLRIDGKNPFPKMYRMVEMHWYAGDEPSKLNRALQWLDRTDYIVLSSNRLYESIPRLPLRFPMTIAYYDALFDGSLGFEQVAEFTSYPRFLGLEIPDQGAAEAFTVYDHPRVLIFKKTEKYSRAVAQSIMGGVDWKSVQRMSPLQNQSWIPV